MNGFNTVRNRMTLGDALGPLPTVEVDTNILLLGGGLLAFIWLLRQATSTVRTYHRSGSEGLKRKKAARRRLRATL